MLAKAEELARKEREEREAREVLFIHRPDGSYSMNFDNEISSKRTEKETKERLAKKELKRSRRAFRGEMPLPNSDLYLASQQQSCVTMMPPPPPPPPPPAMGFPTPTSPMAPPQMLGGDGERVESSDEDGDDEDDEDEFEDSEQTEATATEADVEECLTSEGEELSATPERAATAAEKWVALKGQAPEHLHPSSLPPPPPSPQGVPPGAVAEAVSALSR
ncbi:hypothetical protein EDB83DRAFT_1884439 [Lactarius deliciosus]|nr:hypothetical protein EDB83DRAFT_1884439 [Lactarius deliciosus]